MEEEFDSYDLMTPEEFGALSELDEEPLPSMQMALAGINNVCSLVGNVTNTFAQVSLAAQQTKYEISKLEYELDRFIAENEHRLEKFKAVAPILSKQLENASQRIDKITDTILASSSDSLSDESLKKQSTLVDLLNTSNETFNNLLVKLITI